MYVNPFRGIKQYPRVDINTSAGIGLLVGYDKGLEKSCASVLPVKYPIMLHSSYTMSTLTLKFAR